MLPESRVRGYKAGQVQFQCAGRPVRGCNGDGIIRIEMHFLPDVYVTCESCKGLRFNRDTLEIHYKGTTHCRCARHDREPGLFLL